jgi:hypothetical protein
MRFARLIAILTLLAASLAGGVASAADWASYRDTYRSMVVFEKYGGPKNLIQNLVQVVPSSGDTEALDLTLTGKATNLKLALDPLGRTVFPLLKAAYDENAVLQVSRKDLNFTLRARVSVNVRADGVYDYAELRAACEQALGFARHVDSGARSRQCAGVRFVFEKKGIPAVRVRKADGTVAPLAVVNGPAFDGDTEGAFPTVTYRFAGAERSQVSTISAPVAIAPLFE